jgi:hypothetical protein
MWDYIDPPQLTENAGLSGGVMAACDSAYGSAVDWELEMYWLVTQAEYYANWGA